MATYYFTAAFEVGGQIGDPTSEDEVHLEAQYGFAVDNGSGVTALGSSGSTGRVFETVSIPAATGNQPNQLVISVCSNLIGIDQTQSFVRVAFRPAHDVPPARNLPLAPVNPADAQTLLTGIPLTTTANGTTSKSSVNDGSSYGLPVSYHATQWFFAPMQIAGGQPSGTQLHFEITIEIAILGSGPGWMFFKVDPEMQVDF